MWTLALLPSALIHFERRRSLHILFGFLLLLWCELVVSFPISFTSQILFAVVFFYLSVVESSTEGVVFKNIDEPLRKAIGPAIVGIGVAIIFNEDVLIPLEYLLFSAALINLCFNNPGTCVYGILISFLPFSGEIFGLSSFNRDQLNSCRIAAFMIFQLTIIIDFALLAREKSQALEHQTELLTQASSIKPKDIKDLSDEETNGVIRPKFNLDDIPSIPEIGPTWSPPNSPPKTPSPVKSDFVPRAVTADRSSILRFREKTLAMSPSRTPSLRLPSERKSPRAESDPVTSALTPTRSADSLSPSDMIGQARASSSWEVLQRDRSSSSSLIPLVRWICLASGNKAVIEHFHNLSSGLGYSFYVAARCADIFQQNREFCLVLLDLELGEEVLEAPHTFGSNGKTTPCVAIANEGTTEERELAFQHGMIDYISPSSSKFVFDTLVRESQQMQDDSLSSKRALYNFNSDRFKNNKELQRLQKIFDCFVPKQFQELIAPRGIERIKLGDTVCKSITILFSDIRDFTTMSEAMYINDLMEFLNAYLAFSLPSLEEHGGFVDKFIGDSVMCIFAQRDVCDQVSSAIQASIQMLHSLDSMKDHGFRPSRTGIGINTGRTLIGILGTETRMEPTAIGDSVNLASRTESLCKQYGARLMITEHTYEKLGAKAQNYNIRFLDHVEVKGKKKACKVYEVIDAESEKEMQLKLAMASDYDRAIQYFTQANFTEALVSFRKCLQTFPKEQTCEIYVERCIELLRQGDFNKDNWDGVYRLINK